MRVVAGKAKGVKLCPVPGGGTRPILDRVKTALFDTLRPEICAVTMLDAFAGTGQVGIEALSQGASHCTFLDLNQRAIVTIKRNLAAAKLSQQASVKCQDAFRFLRNTKARFDLIYIAPPQFETLWLQAMHIISERPDVVADGGLVIVQIDPTEYEELHLSAFNEEQQRRYGNTLILFFRKSP